MSSVLGLEPKDMVSKVADASPGRFSPVGILKVPICPCRPFNFKKHLHFKKRRLHLAALFIQQLTNPEIHAEWQVADSRSLPGPVRVQAQRWHALSPKRILSSCLREHQKATTRLCKRSMRAVGKHLVFRPISALGAISSESSERSRSKLARMPAARYGYHFTQ